MPRLQLKFVSLFFLGMVAAMPGISRGDEPSPDDLDFFERRVRPLLVKNCQGCHGAAMQKGGLRLDSRAAALKGGETGPAVVPGKVAEGLLIDAIGYGGLYQMPPKSKLPAEEIATLTDWVRRGAPWPNETPSATASKSDGFNLADRAKHWSFQPVKPQLPPPARNANWPRGDIDKFILAKIEAAGLSPAPPAEKRTWLRRVSFDLTGLPPTPQEVAAFLADNTPQAEETVVDRLLASPHFGERWARHWLDLVRYAETMGHEFDYPIHNAYMYRDYVIRALNADVPYNQFVTEHVAGDLLKTPRRNAADGTNESVIGTSFWWFGEASHSPVDIKQAQCDRLDNQIDVLGKAFLGLTVACARCHDHKFDAITTKDYYALFGILQSTRFDHAVMDDAVASRVAGDVRALKRRIRIASAEMFSAEADAAARQLLDAATYMPPSVDPSKDNEDSRAVASRKLLAGKESLNVTHPMFPWAKLRQKKVDWAECRDEILNDMATAEAYAHTAAANDDSDLLLDFSLQDQGRSIGWRATGNAFLEYARPGAFSSKGDPCRPIERFFSDPQLDSDAAGRARQGSVRSPSFVVSKRNVHVLCSGRGTRVNLVLDGFQLIRSPIYGGLKQSLDHDDLHWHSFDLAAWLGHRAFIEVKDVSAPDPADPARAGGYEVDGYAHVVQAVANDRGPPSAVEPTALSWLKGKPLQTAEQLTQAYAQGIAEAFLLWRDDRLTCDMRGRAQAKLIAALVDSELVNPPSPSERSRALASLMEELRASEKGVSPLSFVSAVTDGDGLDAHLLIRGNHKSPGEVVPRRFLEALGGENAPAIKEGSGRRELAAALVDPANPLVARVYVNRLWHHLFGRGIVATVDNLGIQGEKPSHPELLDWLAARFQEQGWSTKKLLREMALSQAYRMTSDAGDESAEQADPANLLLHRMPVRRLEGEIIRDNLLAVSQRLDRTQFGPSVPVHLTPFMEGRGRPGGDGGPLDGAGRRSVYVEVRRNFLPPMMLAFDVPAPFSCMGRRTVSNVPSQALIMLNDPLVQELARHWATQLLGSRESNEGRIRTMYLAALAREPSRNELKDALAFLSEQANAYDVLPDKLNGEVKPWTDLCHVMFNLKEFIFIE